MNQDSTEISITQLLGEGNIEEDRVPVRSRCFDLFMLVNRYPQQAMEGSLIRENKLTALSFHVLDY